MESVKASKSKLDSTAPVDRVILGQAEGKLITGWLELLNHKCDGLVRFTKADVVNFLIRSHSKAWTDAEVSQIAKDDYDETKWLGWALTKIKNSRKQGNNLTLDELIRFRDTLIGGSPSPRKQRKPMVEDDAGSAVGKVEGQKHGALTTAVDP